MTTVAILGTGKMGGAMARRLAGSGFDLTLWDRTSSKAEELHVGRVVATPAEAARDADVVISSLTNEAAVRVVYLGEQGAFLGASGKLLIDTSTAGPRVAEELAREAHARGARAAGASREEIVEASFIAAALRAGAAATHGTMALKFYDAAAAPPTT